MSSTQPNNPKDYIPEIVKLLKAGNMSFIIGAGFSKNISNRFLSWKELLHDMIVEMYEEERQTWHATDEDLIGKYGYLGIASDYVRRKGYHEAIDNYIEERTPVIERDSNGSFRLIEKGRKIEGNVKVETHKAILNLGAKYIYTFNYDNTLEAIEEKVVTAADKENLKHAEKEYEEIRQYIERYEKQTSQIQDLQKNLQSFGKESGYVISNKDKDIGSLVTELNDKLNVSGIHLKEHHLESLGRDIEINKEKLRNCFVSKESQLESIKTSISEKYSVVKDSKDISISGNKSCIFKLHGSLRDEGKYGFDEDTHLQYIICKEDYDSYPKRHEAFVDLMRISLLREAFCIIGFSCDDPNFLLWMDWVKDIKDRSHNDNNAELPPKYYINVNDEDVPADKQLMLRNHGINILNLTSIYDKERKLTRRDRLLYFFYELQSHDFSDNLWENVDVRNRSTVDPSKTKVTYDNHLVDRDWNLRLSFPYPVVTRRRDDYIREDVIHKMLSNFKNGTLSEEDLKIWILAHNDSHISFITLNSKEETFDAILDNYPEIRTNFANYELISSHIRGKKSKYEKYADAVTKGYISILDSLLSFNLNDAFDLLTSWSPSITYHKVIKMLILKTVFRKNYTDDDVKLLYNEIKGLDEDQVSYTALQLILYSHPSDTFSSLPDNIYSIIEDYLKGLQGRNPKIIRWYDYIRMFENEAFPHVKVKSLGEIVTEIGFGDRRIAPSNALILMMAKGGFLPVFNGQEFIYKDYWFKTVEAVYRNFPAYCLFGTILYGNKDLVKRVAQLYTYTFDPNVRNFLSSVLPSILRATCCHNLSQQIRNNLFIIADYLIKVVPYEEWIDEYKILFKDNNWLIEVEDRGRFFAADRTFAEDALAYISDNSFCNDIIGFCIDFGDKITDYQNRLIISARKNIQKLSDSNVNILYTWMETDMTEVQSFIIFNLHTLLNQDKFQNWLRNVSEKLLKSDIALEATCAYINNVDDKYRQKLSVRIANSHGLWANGIKAESDIETSFEGGRMLNIDEIGEKFNITDDALITIYNKLKLSFKQIQPRCKRGSFELVLNSWERLLCSMVNFLVRHQQLLSDQTDYAITLKNCSDTLNSLHDGKSISERLVSTDDSEVQKAVIDLFQDVKLNGIINHTLDYLVLASVITQKSTKALQTCLNHFSWIIGEHTDSFVQYGFIDVVKLILKSYRPYFTDYNSTMDKEELEWTLEADKDEIEKDMLRLCKWLKMLNRNIGEWEDYKPVFVKNKTIKLNTK